MRYIPVKGMDRECSQIVLGTIVFSPDQQAVANEMLDAFVAAGGNTIDTAHIYNGGKSERAIGSWLRTKDNREKVVIIDKGAHHDENGPRVNEKAIRDDLYESLERLQTDYIDMYLLHRDDLTVPVGEIIDILNEHVTAGLVRVLGVSNWSNERIAEANEYAASQGLKGFTVNSPNLSLAKPNEPRWSGCVSVDSDSLDWHEKGQFPLFSWSSQAGGFFTGRYSPDERENAEMVRVYYSDDNWRRLRRAKQLADEKGFTTNQIALAYVLNQPFPACALIGPEKTEELESSLEALHVQLTDEDIQWLDLRSDDQF